MGWTTRQRARPLRFSVKAEGRIAEVELPSTASGGAAASSRANTARFTSTFSGVFSWTWTVPASADSSCNFARRGSVEKVVRREFRQKLLDVGESLGGRLLVLIPKGDVVASAG